MDKKILKLITSARIGHLTTVSSNLQPYVTPVVFILQQNNIFVPLDDKPKTISVKELKRVKNIEENPKVSFLVDHYEEHWTNLWFVMIKKPTLLRHIQFQVSSLLVSHMFCKRLKLT